MLSINFDIFYVIALNFFRADRHKYR